MCFCLHFVMDPPPPGAPRPRVVVFAGPLQQEKKNVSNEEIDSFDALLIIHNSFPKCKALVKRLFYKKKNPSKFSSKCGKMRGWRPIFTYFFLGGGGEGKRV